MSASKLKKLVFNVVNADMKFGMDFMFVQRCRPKFTLTFSAILRVFKRPLDENDNNKRFRERNLLHLLFYKLFCHINEKAASLIFAKVVGKSPRGRSK